MAVSPRGGEPRTLHTNFLRRHKMENQGSKAPKGHGPGTPIKPGANVAPAGAGKGIIGTVKGDPLKQKIRR